MADASHDHGGGLWPADRPIALSVNVMYEAWSDGVAPGLGPMGNPLKPGVIDHQARSWAAYGAEVGLTRILGVFARHQVRATIYTSGLLAEQHPAQLRAAAADGHAIAAHSWAQEILPAYLDHDMEGSNIDRCSDAIEAAVGVRPSGWISPRCTPSADTAELLAARGYRWTGDVFDRDVPAVFSTKGGPIAGVPFSLEVNDLPMTVRYGNPPEAFTRMLSRFLDGASAAWMGRFCLDLTVHAHLFGRPSGAIELDAALSLAKRADGVWMTSHSDLAASVLDA